MIPVIEGVPNALPAGGGGFEVFDSMAALSINAARLNHLAGLELPLAGKSVLDVGCGVGHLSRFFSERGCRVVCVDARHENIAHLRTLYPGREAFVANVETDSLAGVGRFDIVFCYGLIYHSENPVAALRNIASCCGEILLLETVITDHPRPVVQIVDEPNDTINQAVSGFGCRPSPAFIAMALSRMGFGYVYTTAEPPDFPDFRFEWKNDGSWSRDGNLLRCVFVASRARLDNPYLKLLLESPQNAGGEREFRRIANTDEIWLDVGAHRGEKTLAQAERNRNLRVYAFEANLGLASRLMGRMANYVVLPMAVAEHDGSAAFHMNRYDGASSLLPCVPEGLARWIGGDQLSESATLTVPTIRLDTFLNQAGIPKVAYLKIDAQGADLAVVRSAGARLRDIERISLEVQISATPLYRGASRKDDVLRYLAEAGFTLIETETQSYGQEENLTFARLPKF